MPKAFKKFGLVSPSGKRSIESNSLRRLEKLSKKKKYSGWSIES